ncbi:aspartate--tRNA ligase [Patescibacteria group bacterium]
MLRTHTCGELTNQADGQEVALAGWVNSRRDHGGLIFIDLRDRYGLTQIVFDPKDKAAFAAGDQARSEFVLQITGKVRKRPDDMVNKGLQTGEIEVLVNKIETLAESLTPPFEINDKKRTKASEDLRLKYRYLDLRHKYYQDILAERDKVFQYVREYFHKRNFVDIQTPILANSSPEGARDYLVPSRLHPGKFYALPQAPQQFKQLLMVAGMDRYIQLAPCFRDEDPRADRHPGSFYQIDMEMSFVEREDLYEILEPLLIDLTDKFSDKKILQKPFPRLAWQEAMDKYGSDKPDLRFELEFVELTEIFKDSKFQVFAKAVADGGIVKAMRVPAGAKLTRKQIDSLTEIAKEAGLGGLAYISYKQEPASPILKFLSDKEVEGVREQTEAVEGDIVFFAADKWEKVVSALGKVRSEIAEILKLADPQVIAWTWIYDFPMYSISEVTGQLDFEHNPFSMLVGGAEAFKEKDPTKIKSSQFDIVANGYELGSGSIRNHDPDLLYKAFALANYSKDQVDKEFKHMIEAMKYGAPPHGGCAPGVDRILMLLFGVDSIRDIYAFPKSGSGQDLMTGSPSAVAEKQLQELHIKTIK